MTERHGLVQNTHYPDDAIARDFCALLTLLTRRLTVVLCKSREIHTDQSKPSPLRDFPLPIWAETTPTVWKARPATIAWSLQGIQVQFHHPPVVELNQAGIGQAIDALRMNVHAERIICSARLYAAALERIEFDPETAYQKLISAVDSLSQVEFSGWPGEEERLNLLRENNDTWKFKVAAAINAGLTQDAAEGLILNLSKNDPFSRRKFKKFILEFLDPSILDEEDSLFIEPKGMYPPKEKLATAIDLIWKNRGGVLHGGSDYPPTASVGTSNRIPTKAMIDALGMLTSGGLLFPPVTWFERIVQNTIVRWIRKSTRSIA